jgi:hypothetical protein
MFRADRYMFPWMRRIARARRDHASLTPRGSAMPCQGDGTALVSYTLNGVTVATTIQRQTLANASFSGTFQVQSSITASNCANASDNNQVSGTSTVTITPSANNGLQFQWINPNGSTCTYSGTQTQTGGVAGINGANYSCSTGETGTIDFSGLTSGNGLFGGHMFGSTNSLGCTVSGSFSGLSQ